MTTFEDREKGFERKFAHDEVITVPIMHPSYYFALSQRLDWTPRSDGLILVKEMKLKE